MHTDAASTAAPDSAIDALARAQQRIADLEARLAESEAQHEKLLESSPYCIKLIEDDGRILTINSAGLAMVDSADASQFIGKPCTLVVSPTDFKRVSALLERALDGESCEFDYRTTTDRYFRSTLTPVERTERGRCRLLSITQDITLERHMKDDLDHRVKNMLVSVLGLLQRTASTSGSVDTFVDAFQGRVHALASSHEALARMRWTGADLDEIVDRAVGAHAPADWEGLQGDTRLLPATMCGPLMLALHELATNSVKYGALSSPDGRLDIRSAFDDATLHLTWTESGGPAFGSVSPKHKVKEGVGLTLVRGFIEHDLRGSLDLSPNDDGLVARFTIPYDAA